MHDPEQYFLNILMGYVKIVRLAIFNLLFL
jgi:hypothetical protein